MITYNDADNLIELEIEDSLLEQECPHCCTPYPPDPWEIAELIAMTDAAIPINTALWSPWTVTRWHGTIRGVLGHVKLDGGRTPATVWFVDRLVPGWEARG